MIRLTRFNQSPFFVNAELIEFVETTPDTVVTTVNGLKVRVLEGADEVVRRIEDYRRRVNHWPRGQSRPPGDPDRHTM